AQNHPDRSLPNLRRKAVRRRLRHASNPSRFEASGKPGAVHCAQSRQRIRSNGSRFGFRTVQRTALNRIGQKGRVCHRWWLRGHRPPGLAGKRFSYAYIFAAMEPATGADFCLVLPTVSTAAMRVFLDGFSANLAPDTHAALVLDGAGWHGSRDLVVPDSITLVPLLPYSP
ncbi:hypothetical protein QMO56_26275, partial [Roseomonas sp. E05]|nr:hypothetical protein [Roseomonas sp. E05]